MMSTIEIPAPRPDKSQWLRGVLPIGWRLGSPHGDIVVAPPYSLKPSPGPICVQRKRSVNREKNSVISKFSNNIQINSQPEFFFTKHLWECHHFVFTILLLIVVISLSSFRFGNFTLSHFKFKEPEIFNTCKKTIKDKMTKIIFMYLQQLL